MSIVACVKVYDGIVLGSESMTQLWGQPTPGTSGFVKAFSNARKLFRLGKTKFAVLTYGLGNLGRRSVESCVEEFSEGLDSDCKLNGEQIANGLLGFIRQPYDAAFQNLPSVQQPPLIGFYIAGYAPEGRVGTEWEFMLPQDTLARQARPDDQFGASWRGQVMPFLRLQTGIDPRLITHLKTAGMPPPTIAQVEAAAKQLQSPVVFDGMPLQDAIGFCKFILDTTINSCTYEVGVPSCGGPLHVGIITHADGFEWITRPNLT